MHHSAALTRESGNTALAEAVASLDLEQVPQRLRALCGYAIKLTRTPEEMIESDLGPLRGCGLTDRDIVDLNQVAAYFNYVNRVAQGLGVELEARWSDQRRVTGP